MMSSKKYDFYISIAYKDMAEPRMQMMRECIYHQQSFDIVISDIAVEEALKNNTLLFLN